MERKKVLYILGAGASAGAVPILKEWVAEFKVFSECLELMIAGVEENPKVPESNKSKFRQKLEIILKDCKWLLENSRSQYTVDTFAKKLFITNNDEGLKRLKKIVSTFLIFYHTQETLYVSPVGGRNPKIPHQVRDQRYETLLSYLLGKGDTRIPENVKFISWNYDAQLELALGEFVLDTESIIGTVTNNYSQHYKVNGTIATLDITDSNLKKIDMPFYWMFHHEYEPQDLVTLCYDTIGFGSGISYAWEKPAVSQVAERLTTMNLDSITEVVVIGYSFPFFNSSIDQVILTSVMKKLPNIYLQYPENEHKKILEKIRSLQIPRFSQVETAGKVTLISDIDTFYVPYGT